MEFYKPKGSQEKTKTKTQKKTSSDCTKLEMNDFCFDFVLIYSFFNYSKLKLNISARL